MSDTVILALSKIRLDGGTQSRARLDEEAIEQYAEAFAAKASLPPVVVFFDGADHWLADGFHRVHGATKAERAKIHAEVHAGTRRDAVLYSVGANTTHGLRRTNADKRHAVLMLLRDPEWSTKSDRWVADKCGVSHTFVALQREALATVANAPETRTTKDGREYPSARKAPEPPIAPDPRDNDVAPAAGAKSEPRRIAPSPMPAVTSESDDNDPARADDQPPPGCCWKCGNCNGWYPADVEECPECVDVDDSEGSDELDTTAPEQVSVSDIVRLREQRDADPEFQTIRLAQKAMVKLAPSRAQRMVDFVLDGGELAMLRLGVDWSVTEEQLNAAYRRLSKSAHPDSGGSHAAFTALNHARDLVRSVIEGSHAA